MSAYFVVIVKVISESETATSCGFMAQHVNQWVLLTLHHSKMIGNEEKIYIFGLTNLWRIKTDNHPSPCTAGLRYMEGTFSPYQENSRLTEESLKLNNNRHYLIIVLLYVTQQVSTS